MYPITSGRDVNEQEERERNDEVDDTEYETEGPPLARFGLKTTIFFRSIFVGAGVGGALALVIALIQLVTMGRGVDRFEMGFSRPSPFFVYFFNNLAWCAPFVFLGSIILGSVDMILQWNYETTRRASRAITRAIRHGKRRRKAGSEKRNSRERSAQKIVEPMMHDLNLEIDNEED